MSHAHNNILVALAGQPNCGKSTIFNLLTGARQHVANFPGVTVEKKQGAYKEDGRKIEVVDLPGTYSLTSYTQEERVARDFLLLERPEVVVAVLDSSNLERHFYLLFQLLEMRVPVIACLNMADVTERRGIKVDADRLSESLQIPVVVTNGKTGRGRKELCQAIADMASAHEHSPAKWTLDYGELLEPVLAGLAEKLEARPHLVEDFPPRWLAVKLLENDGEARRIVQHHTHDHGGEDILAYAEERRRILREEHGTTPEKSIATTRYQRATAIVSSCSTRPERASRTFTDKVDAVVLHRVFAPIILAVVLFLFYQVAMVYGTMASDWAFPYINEIKVAARNMLESPDPVRAGLMESLIVDGLVGGIVAILYYVPMFFILFALLAIMEDTGYMARVAFILDRLLRWFGLHGQSTLPMILGGVVVGGCCVPGVLATRAMKDEKARLVTILIMPLMNCLAKLPFYVLIVSLMIGVGGPLIFAGFDVSGPDWLMKILDPFIWGEEAKALFRIQLSWRGIALFGLSVFSFIVALLVAKLFSRTVVKGEPAPFVMELPVYHMPTFSGVLRRAVERVWVFVRKVITIVAVVQVGVWFFVTFPGIGFEREAHFDAEHAKTKKVMIQKAGANNSYASVLQSDTGLAGVRRFREIVKQTKNTFGDNENALSREMGKLQAENPELFLIANSGKDASGLTDGLARKAATAYKKYDRAVGSLRRNRKKEQIDSSFAGWAGKAIEPVSTLAGFEWRMNIAILASFAAKESLVGTLGTIYSVEEEGAGALSASVAQTEKDWTLWHKLAILVFVAMFPPCLATVIVIKNETASWGWAVFASVYPIVLGFLLAMIVFQVGPVLFG